MTRFVAGFGLLLGALSCGDDAEVAERPDVTQAGIEFGSTCAEDSQCGNTDDGAECCTGGKCGPDGWCSPRCDSDQDCPDGFFCIDHDGSRCFMACEDDRDCFTDWLCEEKSDRFTCRYKD